MRAWTRWVAVVLFAVVVGVFATVGLAADAASEPPARSPGFVPSDAQITEEVAELRTQRSRTYETVEGRRVTRVFAGSVNYRSGGEWRAIDNRLERTADGDLTNGGNRYDVQLPEKLGDGAVTVEHGAASLGFELQGAGDVAARADGASATYAEALPDVDVRYDVLADAVKETLVLKSADAARQYRFDLDLSGGLAAQLTDAGDLAVIGTDGQARFTVPAPIAWQDGDEDQPTREPVSFAYDADEQVLTLEVDDRWLSAPERRFPVSVDPWVALPSDGRDCTLSSKPAEHTTPFCLGNLQVGKLSGYNQNALIDFNVADQLPEWVTVREAYAALWLKSALGTWQEHTAHALTRPFVDGQASWANAGTGVPWTAPGGDFRAEPASVKWFNGTAASTWSYWSMSDQAQRWADGTDADHGLLLRATANPATWGGNFAASSDAVASHQPYFVVDYEPTYGDDGNFTFVHESVPGIQSGVNVATGGLTVRELDDPAIEDASSFALERVYNSADTRVDSPLMTGWKLSAAPKASTNGNEHLVVEMPSGTVLRFPWDESTQAYGPDRYGNAAASATNTHWIVERKTDGERFFFDKSNGRLTARQGAGQMAQIIYAYGSDGRLSTVTAPDDEVTTLAYDSEGVLSGATLPDGQVISYGYVNGRLAHRTAGSDTTGYTYAGGRLTQIWSPTGKVKFEYDAQGRVERLTRVTDLASNTGPTTTFAYHRPASSACGPTASGSTTVTNPSGDQIEYCWSSSAAMERSLSTSGPGAPSLVLSGPLYAARSGLLTAGTYALSADASGASSVELMIDGQVEQEWSSAPATWTLDPADLEAGRHTISIKVTDSAGRWAIESFSVTAPAAPAGDGTVPGEGEPVDPTLEAHLDAAKCVEHYGAGSPSCVDEPEISTLAASPNDLLYGIADDDVRADQGLAVSYLGDERFQVLQIKRVRRVLPWNIMRTPNRLAAFQRFYDQANASGVEIMVSFQFDCPDGPVAPTPPACYREGPTGSGSEPLPDWREYVRAVRDFKSHFVKIRFLSPWNEPNHPRQPFHRSDTGAKAFAKYTYYLERYVCAPRRRANGKCDVLAGEVYPRRLRSELKYLRDYKRQLDVQFSLQGPSDLVYPKRWAYHPYTDLKKYASGPARSVTREYLRIIGKTRTLWFTEVGAYTRKGTEIVNSEVKQAAQVRYLYDELATYDDRIDRVYYYHFCEGDDGHDSGLLGRRPAEAPVTTSCGGDPRSAHTALKNRSVKDPAPAN